MGFYSKFKISLYHEHFENEVESFEKYSRFPEFPFQYSVLRINGEAYIRLNLLLLSMESKCIVKC